MRIENRSKTNRVSRNEEMSIDVAIRYFKIVIISEERNQKEFPKVRRSTEETVRIEITATTA